MKNNIIFLATRLSAIAFLIAVLIILGRIFFNMTEDSLILFAFSFIVLVGLLLLAVLFFLAQDIATRNYKSSKPSKF